MQLSGKHTLNCEKSITAQRCGHDVTSGILINIMSFLIPLWSNRKRSGLSKSESLFESNLRHRAATAYPRAGKSQLAMGSSKPVQYHTADRATGTLAVRFKENSCC